MTKFDPNPLNSPVKIIIKKENIGLHEHQHQRYQYNLFNNNEKRDQIYDDLSKVKDRLEKAPPNMQQVINMDMKRTRTNKILERKLTQDLNGPRGLNWQYKYRLQRLQNDEREAERDLIRLNHDRVRASLGSLSNRELLPRPSTHLVRFQSPRLSMPIDAFARRLSRTKSFFERPMSIYPDRTSIDRFIPLDIKRLSISTINSLSNKSPRVYKQMKLNFDQHNPRFRVHVASINQEKRQIEHKLKEFLH